MEEPCHKGEARVEWRSYGRVKEPGQSGRARWCRGGMVEWMSYGRVDELW